jgi:hypothetical protein
LCLTDLAAEVKANYVLIDSHVDERRSRDDLVPGVFAKNANPFAQSAENEKWRRQTVGIHGMEAELCWLIYLASFSGSPDP